MDNISSKIKQPEFNFNKKTITIKEIIRSYPQDLVITTNDKETYIKSGLKIIEIKKILWKMNN